MKSTTDATTFKYHLNCILCGKAYWSKIPFPKPQLCFLCKTGVMIKGRREK